MVKNDVILKVLDEFLAEAVETKATKNVTKLRDRIQREMQAGNPSLAASSLSLEEVEACLKLVDVSRDQEVDSVPPHPLPDELGTSIRNQRHTLLPD